MLATPLVLIAPVLFASGTALPFASAKDTVPLMNFPLKGVTVVVVRFDVPLFAPPPPPPPPPPPQPASVKAIATKKIRIDGKFKADFMAVVSYLSLCRQAI